MSIFIYLSQALPDLGGVGPNDVLRKNCRVLLRVLEQPRIYNYSAGSFIRGAKLGLISNYDNNSLDDSRFI